jgi:hypothetical protein
MHFADKTIDEENVGRIVGLIIHPEIPVQMETNDTRPINTGSAGKCLPEIHSATVRRNMATACYALQALCVVRRNDRSGSVPMLGLDSKYNS